MTESDRLEVFRAQTLNVRELETAWRHVNRGVNVALLTKSDKTLEVQTRLLALIYCALAEAIFSKMLHTPHGLSLNQIDQIKTAAKTNGVKVGWVKCAELASMLIAGAKSNHQPNVLQKLTQLIEEFIFDPSLIRNKLAHGQWSVALNRENTAINSELSDEIARLDVLLLQRRKVSLQGLSRIMEDIIESPQRTHFRDYWSHLQDIEDSEREMQGWTIETKRQRLLIKWQKRPLGK